MHFGRFLAAWLKDWTALMSGFASIILLFWATFRPPSQEQARQGLLALSAVCFVVGSYRIWAKEHQRWTALTGKTKIELLDDRISEFQALRDWYGSDSQTARLPLEKLIEETLDDLRYHAPDYVHQFKDAVKNWQQSISIADFPQRSRTLKN